MPALSVIPFAEEHLDDAALLLAERHRLHRLAEPLLDPRFEAREAARAEIELLWRGDGSSGAVAMRAGRVVGYLLGFRRNDHPWGPNMWVEPAGHAAQQAEDVRDLYALAAAPWVEAGRIAHYVLVPASDTALVDAWFRLGFGQQHVHALREAPAAPPAGLPDGVRRATRDDIEALARLDLVLPEHQALSPVFSSGGLQTMDEALQEWEDGIDDPAFANFVVELDGRVVGSAIACSVDESSLHGSVARPHDAGFLGFAAVLPEARGHGLGRALGEAVTGWAAQAGYRTVVTDWRMTNLLSSRTWPRLGFRPVFLRLHRLVGH
jgi:GNAT superfamily N-acetyltransferase